MEPQNPNDLIPLGAPAPGFDVVIRGYDRAQVAEAIERLEQDVRVTVGERDQAIARANELHQQLERLSSDMNGMQERLRTSSAPSFESMGERISSMLRLAEEEAADIRRGAAEEVAGQREESERLQTAAVDAERIASERANNLEAKAKAHADELVAQAQSDADTRRSDAEEQVAALLAESESRRQRDEDDFEIALNSRRSEAQRLEAERERTSRDEAERLVADATAHSEHLRAEADGYAADLRRQTEAHAAQLRNDADSEVHRLRNVRAAVARQIFDVGTLIGTIPQELAQDPEPLPAAQSADVSPDGPADAEDPAAVEADFVQQELIEADAALEAPEPRPGDLPRDDADRRPAAAVVETDAPELDFSDAELDDTEYSTDTDYSAASDTDSDTDTDPENSADAELADEEAGEREPGYEPAGAVAADQSPTEPVPSADEVAAQARPVDPVEPVDPGYGEGAAQPGGPQPVESPAPPTVDRQAPSERTVSIGVARPRRPAPGLRRQ